MNLPVYLYVTPFFPEPGRHYGNYCLDAVRAIQRTGRYDVRVFVPESAYRKGRVVSDYEIEGVHVFRFSTRGMPFGCFPLLFRKRNEAAFLQAVIRAGIDLKSVSVCHGHTALFAIYPLAVKRFNPSCLTLLHHHDLASFGLNHGRAKWPWLYRIWMFCRLRTLHEAIDCHVFISNLVKSSFLRAPDTRWSCYNVYRDQMRGLEFLKSVRVRHLLVCHNGVDLNKFNARGRRPRMNGSFHLGAIGNFWELKDFSTLLVAFAKVVKVIPNVYLTLVGHGPCESEMRGIIDSEDLGGRVNIVREMPHEKMADFYRSLDLFVLPSYFEGFGCVYTEAWACGTPFITTSQTGVIDLLSEPSRQIWVVEPRHPEDLAQKIVRVLRECPKQVLVGEVDINAIVLQFLNQLEQVRS